MNRDPITLVDLHPEIASLRREVLSGLRKPQKELPAKLFYDERGSRLFEEITRLPEYYLTRSEISILEQNAGEIVSIFGKHCTLVELGSGNSVKARILLDRIGESARYMPVDISLPSLREAAAAIAADYPGIEVVAVCADYTMPFELPRSHGPGRQVIFFPGSTVGNFQPAAAKEFFRETARMLQPGDGMLIGVDLKKDPARLHAAYNDARGVTAEFNRNILRRINEELAADFDADSFEHVAHYDERRGRIEMHLRSPRAHSVTVDGEKVAFRMGETIHTENSYKYEVGEFHELFEGSGLQPLKVWVDPEGLFSVHYLNV